MENNIEIEKEISKNTVKVSTLRLFVEWYLEMLNFTGAIRDEEFARCYKQLMDCVNGKLKLSQANNILAEYVVYEIE